MSEIKKCDNCLNTDSKKFRSLKEEKWREAERRGLIKDKWEEGIILCNKCYMNYVKNPLKRTTKRMKISVQEIESIREETQIPVNEDVEAVNEEIGMVDLVGAIKTMARFFYDREHVTNKSPIYSYDELQEEFQTNKGLKNFLDQLYLAARPFECTNQTMDRMKKLIVHICYLLASLNNTKINAFKFDLAYYLDSVGTSNEGLDMMTNLDVAATLRAVDRKKKKISDAHKKYVENGLSKYLDRAFVLNIDDYHNIHVPRQSDSTSTSRPTHMATIVANSCSMATIPSNGVLNPKFLDGDLIIKHLDEWFIISLGIPYHERCQNYRANNLLTPINLFTCHFGKWVEKDERKAFNYYQKLAEMDDSYGIFSVELCYENGVGVEKDEHKAFIYYQKSAEMGDVNRIHNVGYCYLYGVGVEKDEHKAFFYFQKSAEMGGAMGTNIVGYCYQLGIGVEIDSIHILSKAVEMGYALGTNNVGCLLQKWKWC
ncbi:hypothetical protein C2G38_2173942 [Gigaspora rosea]|uniref:HCP-like protein n=1 Tax=Gigaspora rosea TaxID=44941 RepID=A0A397VJ32_9GLOM|nr:hypothetical protein C2G38_2173942 [Gigaspora rosea]